MEGLEASSLSLNEVLINNQSFRFDAEYFQKQFIKDNVSLDKHSTDKLINLTLKIDVGYVGAMVDEYKTSGIKLLQTKNIDAFFVNDFGLKFIDERFNAILKKSIVTKENLLIARSGSFGKASIFLSEEKVNSSDIIIVEANKDLINPYFLVTFINSKIGVNQLIKFASGGLQGHVNLTILENLKVPILADHFQTTIERIILQAYTLHVFSEDKYSDAERYFLSQVQLADWNPPKEKYSIKSFTESYLQSGRLDSEYYQPKYFEIVEHVRQQNFDYLGNLVHIKKSIEPGSDAYLVEGIPFIRVADLSKFGLSEPEIFLDRNEYDVKYLMPRKDNILLSKDGSVGIAYKMAEDKEVITSGAILHLSITDKRLLPDYLCLVLNSIVVQYQAERDAGGSIIQHWKPDEIKQVVIPILSQGVQEKITELVQESFALQNQSKQLLDAAKHAVELAVEKNEEIAVQWLNTQNITQ